MPLDEDTVPRYTIMKYQNTLKRFQRGKPASYMESGIKLPSCSKQQHWKQDGNLQQSFQKFLKENYFQLRVLYLAKLSIKSKANK